MLNISDKIFFMHNENVSVLPEGNGIKDDLDNLNFVLFNKSIPIA